MTTHKTLVLAPAALAIALATSSANAHHSRANFDLNSTQTFVGTVKRFAWTNPHTAIYIETTTPDGEVIVRTLEGNSIPTMVRRGWAKDSVKPGDKIVVKVNPDKDPNRHFYYLLSATMNGDQIGGGFGSEKNHEAFVPAPAPSSSPFVGVWRPIFSFGGFGGSSGDKGGDEKGGGKGGGKAILLASPMPSYLPVTAKGKASYATFPSSEDPRDRCVPESLPAAISTVPYMFEIKQKDNGNFVVLNENYAAPRTIHMHQSAPPAGTKPDYDGYSVGHLEGNTLVVKTTLFTPEPWGNDTGLDSSSEKTIVGRYNVTNNGDKLQITYAQSDPVYLAKTVTRTLSWNRSDSQLANIWDGSRCTRAAGERHLTAE